MTPSLLPVCPVMNWWQALEQLQSGTVNLPVFYTRWWYETTQQKKIAFLLLPRHCGDLSITKQLKKKLRKKKESSDLFPSTSCKWGDDRGQSTSETITLPICRPRFHFPYSRHRYTLIRHWLKHAIDAYVAINNFSLVAYIAIPLFFVLNIHAGLSIKIVSELYCIKLILYYLRRDFVPLFLFYAPFFFCFLLFLF